tara:strand:- start:1844 stop:2311 length:468 start_codon:yes stop_codon:yes gene_type:complete
MDYYLYSHSNANGIFYIGKGCKNRKKEKRLSKRSLEWHEASKNGYTTKIEASGSEKCILLAEKMYINLLLDKGVNLVNKYHNYTWNKTFSNKHKKNLSDSLLGAKNYMSGLVGNKSPIFGLKRSKTTKEKMAYSQRKYQQHKRLEKANNFKGETI